MISYLNTYLYIVLFFGRFFTFLCLHNYLNVYYVDIFLSLPPPHPLLSYYCSKKMRV